MKLSEIIHEAKNLRDLGDFLVEIGPNEDDGDINDNLIDIRILHKEVLTYWDDPQNKDPNTRKPQPNIPDDIGRAELEEYNEYWTIHPNVTKGWGPFVYEIAIEYATLNGKGIIPASSISKLYGYPMEDTPASENVWRRFYERSDVHHVTLPQLVGLQPEWLYCIYTKSPNTIEQLKSAGKLI